MGNHNSRHGNSKHIVAYQTHRNDRENFYNETWPSKLKELESELDEQQVMKLDRIGKKLMDCMENRTNYPDHAFLQLVCSQYMLKKGYDVIVEYWEDPLRCDIKAYGPGSNDRDEISIEVETGHTYPESRIMEVVEDRRGREIRKIGLYSYTSKRFAFCIPSNYVLQLPKEFAKPPDERDSEKMMEYLGVCHNYCRRAGKSMKPTFEDLLNAELDMILIVDPVGMTVTEKNVKEYMSTCSVY